MGLTRGRNREQLTDDLISEAKRDREMIAGLDFALSFPASFVRQRGCTSAHDVWTACEERGEDWLRACAPPFWGRPGRRRPADAGAQGSAALSSTRRASAVSDKSRCSRSGERRRSAPGPSGHRSRLRLNTCEHV